MTYKEDVYGAIARGYCTKENDNKMLDTDLCNAISEEVCILLTEARKQLRKEWLEEEIAILKNEKEKRITEHGEYCKLRLRPCGAVDKPDHLADRCRETYFLDSFTLGLQISRLKEELKALDK